MAFGAAPAHAQLFQQDFSSSSTLSTYINASTPTTGQWNAIGISASGPTVGIVGNALQLTRNGSRTAGFARTTDFAPIPTSMLYQVDVTVSGNSSATTAAATFQLGSGFTTTIAT